MKVRYACKYCKATNEIITIWKWMFTPHLGARKYLRCKTCNRISAMKRQDGRKILDWYTEKN